ncbi:GyrI-like domain-containing protein [Paenibacillus paeoniae]|uniref:AraC family transcriptional regulator n=1 Tax=Paenibacillus paeoniae TaxID=2292705 RepID=A0A371PHD6_9BACL|nr:GyrI-like domain-containing protein [Paenibacillus paeoniae]REK75036.1 AraC family transcriptional regulator [Paenibacillus paeoniae]
MEFRIVTKPGFDVIGYAIRTRIADGQNHRDIPAFWQGYKKEKLDETLYEQAISTAEYGICDNFDMETGEFSYIIGVEAREGAEAPEGTVRCHYPEQTYAVFTIPKSTPQQFSDSIQRTWGFIMEEWLPHAPYVHGGTAEFEYYDERCWPDRNELLEMDIYIPIQPKIEEA